MHLTPDTNNVKLRWHHTAQALLCPYNEWKDEDAYLCVQEEQYWFGNGLLVAGVPCYIENANRIVQGKE